MLEIITFYVILLLDNLVIVEKGKNIFDFSNHKKIAVYLEEKHKTRIEKTEDDILFIE